MAAAAYIIEKHFVPDSMFGLCVFHFVSLYNVKTFSLLSPLGMSLNIFFKIKEYLLVMGHNQYLAVRVAVVYFAKHKS